VLDGVTTEVGGKFRIMVKYLKLNLLFFRGIPFKCKKKFIAF
jgi:hypothetical protein